jgi:hypothetical protein
MRAWVKNPVVSSIKQAVTALGNTNRPLREQLLSLLSLNYPKSWLQDHIGVGRTTTMRAADHAKAFGPGLYPDPGATHNIARDRRVGPKEEFIRIWMLRKGNFEASPEIKRGRSGVLVQQPTTYRVLNQNRGDEKYTADVMKEGYPHYSRSHFYLRNAEMGLMAGLCHNCNRYGKENWDHVRKCIIHLYCVTDPKRKPAEDE